MPIFSVTTGNHDSATNQAPTDNETGKGKKWGQALHPTFNR